MAHRLRGLQEMVYDSLRHIVNSLQSYEVRIESPESGGTEIVITNNGAVGKPIQSLEHAISVFGAKGGERLPIEIAGSGNTLKVPLDPDTLMERISASKYDFMSSIDPSHRQRVRYTGVYG